jgi:hypothetical protein
MAFCEPKTIQNLTGIDTDTYEDDEISDFIMFAQREVLSNIQQKVLREYVTFIDNTRQNNINGTNTTFYFKNWKGNYLGDMDYDGDVDTDDIKVYSVDSNGTETELTVTSVDYENMSFTLSSAPSNVELYVTYCYSPFDLVLPDPFVSQVTAYLASAYVSISDGSDDSFRAGNVSFGGNTKGITGNKYYQKYQELMTTLTEQATGGAIWGESLVRI